MNCVSEIEMGPFRILLKWDYTGESPNDVYEDWQRVDRHIGGETVALPAHAWCVQTAETTHWRHCDMTPGSLARELRKEAREHPDRAAYQLLQARLIDEVCGSMLYVTVTVYVRGVEIADDGISIACGINEDPDDVARDAAEEHFDVFELLKQGYEQARQILNAYKAA